MQNPGPERNSGISECEADSNLLAPGGARDGTDEKRIHSTINVSSTAAALLARPATLPRIIARSMRLFNPAFQGPILDHPLKRHHLGVKGSCRVGFSVEQMTKPTRAAFAYGLFSCPEMRAKLEYMTGLYILHQNSRNRPLFKSFSTADQNDSSLNLICNVTSEPACVNGLSPA
jgi:hypothetical protein